MAKETLQCPQFSKVAYGVVQGYLTELRGLNCSYFIKHPLKIYGDSVKILVTEVLDHGL